MITLSAKDTTEVISISFDYSQILSSGETLTGATVGLSILRGIDADVGTMLTGGASIADGIVSHLVRNGVSGVDYLVDCLATTSQGQSIKIFGVLPVRAQS